MGNLATPKSVQKLQTALHAKAKAEAGYRFYALYDKISRDDILAHAYAQCRSNKGAPGIDGQDFADIEAYGVERWLAELALGLEQSLGTRLVTYADDLVILCRRGSAENALHHLRQIMGKLKLTVNEEKTRICRVPDGEFDFLGYTFGRMYSPETGKARLGYRPSKKSIKRMVEKSPRADRPSGYLAGDHKAGGSVEPGAPRMGQLL